MQTHRPVNELIDAIREWQSVTGLSFPQISEKCGVNLSTVYRVFDPAAQHSKVGVGIKKICKNAKISLTHRGRSSDLPVVLSDALLTVWDGTDGHARRLAAAISAIGNLDKTRVSSAKGKR